MIRLLDVTGIVGLENSYIFTRCWFPKNFKSYGQLYPAELSSVHNKFFKDRRHYEHSEPVVSNSSGCIEINMRLSFQLSEITRLPS